MTVVAQLCASLLLVSTLLECVCSQADFPRTQATLDGRTFFLPNVVVVIGNSTEKIWQYERNADIDSTVFRTFSAVKWITSATILRLVNEGAMSLDDSPSRFLDYWTHEGVTVQNLLSFTSGINDNVFCAFNPFSSIDQCARNIAGKRLEYEPGTIFNYGLTHMQILGAMAQEATGLTWQEIFDSRVGEVLGMTSTVYDFPSKRNPALAASCSTTAREFDLFVRTMFQRDPAFLAPELWEAMFQDQTPTTSVEFAPRLFTSPIYEFHFGLGVWRECIQPTYDPSCDPLQSVSVTGLSGMHGWIDFANNYYGVMVTNGGAMRGRFNFGFGIEDLRVDVRADLEDLLS